jgi:hypothetical protein
VYCIGASSSAIIFQVQRVNVSNVTSNVANSLKKREMLFAK